MDFRVMFYTNHDSKGLIDYSQVLSGGIQFIDHIKGIDPKYKNLNPRDIRYIRRNGRNIIANNRYDLFLSLDQARETGHFNDCTEIGVLIDGRMNAFSDYIIKEHLVRNFSTLFFKKLEYIEVYVEIIDDAVYTAWKAAGFPRMWKI